MKDFWKQLKKPILCLAPMEEVTDVVFREILTKTHSPDVFFTEFTNVEALCSDGYENTVKRLQFTENQKPIVAQIWGLKPENYTKSAEIIEKLGFDGIDINMGCPQRKVVKNGACSALIENPNLAAELIKATKEGTSLPVSVKTRIGYKTIVTKDWISFLLKQDIAALTIHGRTQKEMSAVPVHWDEIEKARKLRDEISPLTPIIGNGDVKNYKEAVEKSNKYKLDGIMIGRGIFQNLWAFDPENYNQEFSKEKHLKLIIEHLELWDKTWKNQKNYNEIKRFFKIYIREFSGAPKLREKLMTTNSPKEALDIITSYQVSQDQVL